MSKKPTISDRVASTKTLHSTPSMAVVAVRPSACKQEFGKLAAAWSGILSLVVCAGVGVYFTAKQRAWRPLARPPALIEAAGARAPAPDDDAPSVVIEPPPASTGPVRTAPRHVQPPPRIEPEQTVIAPGDVAKAAIIVEAEMNPGDVNPEKLRPDPTIEPQPPAAPALADAGNDMPKHRVAVRPPATEPPERDPRCHLLGTKIDFFNTAGAAYEAAKKDNKLVLLVHCAGEFDKDKGSFTCEKAEEYRQKCLCAEEVAEFLKPEFVCVCQSISSLRPVHGIKPGGNVVSYFCLSDGTVLDAIPGPVSPQAFLAEGRWVVQARNHALAEYRKDMGHYAALIRKAHGERYFKETDNDIMAPNGVGPFGPPPWAGMRKGFAHGAMGGFRGFKQFGQMFPFAPMPDFQPPTAHRLPTKRPIDLPAQEQVHWLLARGTGLLPKVNAVYKEVYEVILKERIVFP